MEDMIRTSILMGIIYSFYFFFLRRETFFQLNRFYLLLGTLTSLLIPFLPTIQIINEPSTGIVRLMEGVTIRANLTDTLHENTPGLINPVIIFYLGGVSWFSLRFITSLAKMGYLYLRFPKTTVNGLKTVVIKGDQTPFTFFNILFTGENDLEVNTINGILAHEMVHIDRWHSLDLILMELVCIVQWFNPFGWLLRAALKIEHEYEADDQVMKKGYSKLAYQKLLFERTTGIHAFALANNFNFSLLRKRIEMMSKNKSKDRVRFKYLLVLPLIVGISLFMMTEGTKASEPNDSIYYKVDVMPEYPGGIEAVRMFIAEHLEYPEVAKKLGLEGRVFVQFVVEKDGSVQNVELVASRIRVKGQEKEFQYKMDEERQPSEYDEGIMALENEALRVTRTIPDFTSPGMQKGKPVKVQYTFPMQFSME